MNLVPMERLGGFKTEEDQLQRFEELRSYGDGLDMKACNGVMQAIDYGFLVTPSMKEHLTMDELSRVEQVPHQLQIVSYQPKLFRFMDEQYVDEFVKTGALMLTTVGRCRHLEDSNRCDKSEGEHTLLCKDSGMRIETKMRINDKALMLCTSLCHNHVITDPSTDNEKIESCALEIIRPFEFMQCVTQALLEQNIMVTKVLFGPCWYADGKLENRFSKGFIKDLAEDAVDKETGNLNKIFNVMATIGQDDVYFKKPLAKSFEQEYRFVWEHATKLESDTLILQVPEARQFCAKRQF